jgi:hypothetical protein
MDLTSGSRDRRSTDRGARSASMPRKVRPNIPSRSRTASTTSSAAAGRRSSRAAHQLDKQEVEASRRYTIRSSTTRTPARSRRRTSPTACARATDMLASVTALLRQEGVRADDRRRVGSAQRRYGRRSLYARGDGDVTDQWRFGGWIQYQNKISRSTATVVLEVPTEMTSSGVSGLRGQEDQVTPVRSAMRRPSATPSCSTRTSG